MNKFRKRVPLILAAAFGALALVACKTTPDGGPQVRVDPAARAAAGKAEQSRLAKLASNRKAAEAAMSAARELENAGDPRGAIGKYSEAFPRARELETDTLAETIRDRILNATSKLRVKPAVPETARRFGIRGEAVLQRAKTRAEFARAAGEFTKASNAAPWWSSAYYNLALAREGAGDAIGAIKAYRQFLTAEPRAREAPTIRDRIFALEVDAEDQRERRKWVGHWRSSTGSLVRTELKGRNLTMFAEEPSAEAKKNGYIAGQVYFEGVQENDGFKGASTNAPCGKGAHRTCKQCLGTMRQYSSTARLVGKDSLVVEVDDLWISQWNIYTCAITNKVEFKRKFKYTRDRADERSNAGS